ncbi:6092_t:CDS:2, partial [Ambispora gerdemannii]
KNNYAKKTGLSFDQEPRTGKRLWDHLEVESTAVKFKRNQKSNYPEIEEAMLIWVDQAIARELTIQGTLVQEKAKWFAERLGRREESGSAPIEDIPRFRIELQDVLRGYPLENIFN